MTDLEKAKEAAPSSRPEYCIWHGMRSRCLKPSTKCYPRYGGRGITICSRWAESFNAFVADMGPRPSVLHSLERINNNGPYSPENCRWATILEQQNNTRYNRRITFHGKTQTLAQWGRELGVSSSALRGRLDNWPIERALTERGHSHDEVMAILRRGLALSRPKRKAR